MRAYGSDQRELLTLARVIADIPLKEYGVCTVWKQVEVASQTSQSRLEPQGPQKL
jgi:hypothetical protein